MSTVGKISECFLRAARASDRAIFWVGGLQTLFRENCQIC